MTGFLCRGSAGGRNDFRNRSCQVPISGERVCGMPSASGKHPQAPVLRTPCSPPSVPPSASPFDTGRGDRESRACPASRTRARCCWRRVPEATLPVGRRAPGLLDAEGEEARRFSAKDGGGSRRRSRRLRAARSARRFSHLMFLRNMERLEILWPRHCRCIRAKWHLP